MAKVRLFDYRESGIYYKKFGISPDMHYVKLCEVYGRDTALKTVEENMEKAFESWWEKEREKAEEEERILDAECPF